MSDLIKREDAIDVLEILSDKMSEEGQTVMAQAVAVLKDLHSAEPELKKGEWIDEKINSYTSRTYCSECGSSAPFVYKSDDYYGNRAYGETAKTKFCPNCGADMRGEHE